MERYEERYEKWMVGDDAATERSEAAKLLLDAIETRHVDNETLEDLNAILSFELLCQHAKAGRRPSDLAIGPFQTAFSHNWTDGTVELLSRGLVRSINQTTHLERELQSRALVTALALLSAQGVEALEDNYYATLSTNLQNLFRGLQWEPGASGPHTTAKFHKLNCSFLLSFAWEHSRNFQRARPVAVAIIDRFKHILSLSLIAAGPAMGGSINLQNALNDLKKIFEELPRRPDSRYQHLFTLHEFVNHAIALDLYAKVAKGKSTTDSLAIHALQWSQGFAKLTLEISLSIIIECAQINDLAPPSNFWGQFRAASSQGPPGFDQYFFIYGVLDCCSSIGKMLGPHLGTPNIWPQIKQVLRELRSVMVELVGNCSEPTLRWKALEYLSAMTESSRQLQHTVTSHATMDTDASNRLQFEVDTIFKSLHNGSAIYPQPRADASADDVLLQLSPSNWDEPTFEAPTITESSERYSASLEGRGYHSAGLAPNCKAAIFSKPKAVYLYFLARSGKSINPLMIAKLTSGKNTIIQAAISNEYVVTISKHELRVTRYDEDRECETVYTNFDSGSGGCAWSPAHCAIHDAKDRTWIAVGGHIGSNKGCITIYEVSRSRRETSLKRHFASFNRTNPDPLGHDLLKSVRFSPNGLRLVCLTQNNRILIWFLSNNARPRHAPFEIKRRYSPETGSDGITSASMFLSPSGRAYVLATTAPSSERNLVKDEEWSFISAIGDAPCSVPSKLSHCIRNLGHAGAIICGAASPRGDMVALLEASGKIFVFPLACEGRNRGLSCGTKVTMKERLCSQEMASSMALRFSAEPEGMCLYAVDTRGRVFYKCFDGTAELTPVSSQRHSLTVRSIGSVQS